MDTPDRGAASPASPALEHARALLERHVPTLTVVPCDTLELLHRTSAAALRYVEATDGGDPEAMHDAFTELAASVGRGDSDPQDRPVARARANLYTVAEAVAETAVREHAARRALRARLTFAGMEAVYATGGALVVAGIVHAARGSVPPTYWAFPPLAVVAALLIPGKARWREVSRTVLLLVMWVTYAILLDAGSLS